MLTIVVAVVFLALAARAEAEAFYAMTPPWFVPYGAIIGAIGLLASVFAIRGGPHAAMRLACLGLFAFAPGFMFRLVRGETEALSASAKTAFGIFFSAAPWITLAGAMVDRRADHSGSVR
ncbi:hypothetical protein ACXIVK_35790 [Paraburkholderia caledonica]